MSIYMQSTLEIESSGMEQFIEGMTRAVPILEGSGWKLVSAFMQVTGRLHTVVDLWTMDDFNHYDKGLQTLMAHPFFPEFQRVINATVEKEVVTLGYGLPYAPGWSATNTGLGLSATSI